jgi:hypothetical protein
VPPGTPCFEEELNRFYGRSAPVLLASKLENQLGNVSNMFDTLPTIQLFPLNVKFLAIYDQNWAFLEGLMPADRPIYLRARTQNPCFPIRERATAFWF